MKTVDAVWEKRNLGVDTQEVTVEEQDSVETVKKTLNSLTAEYQVVKAPCGKIKIMWAIEDSGFHYMETSIRVVYDLNRLEIPPQYKRINDAVDYAIMNEEDVEEMFEQIQKGMFFTDRVALDPFFSVAHASNRYCGWLQDEIKKGTKLYKYIYKGKSIGFFSLKQINEKTYYPFLAGIYPEYKNSPLGSVYLFKPLVEAKKQGGRFVSTYISTNNSQAVRMHADYGFLFKETQNVYVKHGGQEC